MFTSFKALINITHDNINLCWIINMNTNIDHLVFEYVSQQHIQATSTNQVSAPIVVTRDIYGDVLFMKQQCQEIAIQFITKLQGRFHGQNLMDAL